MQYHVKYVEECNKGTWEYTNEMKVSIQKILRYFLVLSKIVCRSSLYRTLDVLRALKIVKHVFPAQLKNQC